MTGATGAVGTETLTSLLAMPEVTQVTLLERRAVSRTPHAKLTAHVVDLEDADSYRTHLDGHSAAICTVGVGQPSKVSKEEFVRIDHDIPLGFARSCRAAHISHFEILSSVGVSASSNSHYLRTKGEMEDSMRALGFPRLSLFHPSMILTPSNRYGVGQAITLAVWPVLTPVLIGPLRRTRGVRVEQLGRAIARNLVTTGSGEEVLEWDDFQRIAPD
jgi:uncharacterized protein YbjT (DUF2867 family)